MKEDCGVPFAGGSYTCSMPKGHTDQPGDKGHGDCSDCNYDTGESCKRHTGEEI